MAVVVKRLKNLTPRVRLLPSSERVVAPLPARRLDSVPKKSVAYTHSGRFVVQLYDTVPAGFWSTGEVFSRDSRLIFDFKYFVRRDSSESVAWLYSEVRAKPIADYVRVALINYRRVNRVVTDGTLPEDIPSHALLEANGLQIVLSGSVQQDGWRSFTLCTARENVMFGNYLVEPSQISVRPPIRRHNLRLAVEAGLQRNYGPHQFFYTQ